MKLLKIGLGLCLIATLFLSVSPIYADDSLDEDSEMKVDISIDGELNVNIDVSGPAELNVESRGPSEVNINTDERVNLKVQASDESQIFAGNQGIDNPTQIPTVLSATYQEGQKVDGRTSKLNSYLPIIAGAFLVLGLLTFLLVRRKMRKV